MDVISGMGMPCPFSNDKDNTTSPRHSGWLSVFIVLSLISSMVVNVRSHTGFELNSSLY